MIWLKGASRGPVSWAMAVFVLVGGSLSTGCAPRHPDLTKVTVATSKNMWCSLTHVAQAKGYFADEGLQVDTKYLDAGRYCLDAVVSGSADFGNVVEVNIAYMGYTKNTNLEVIGSIVSSTSSAVVGLRSAGINTPQDLRGRQLALSPGTTSEVFAHRFLAKYGISASEVKQTDLQPVAMQGAVVSKAIDAASTWEPFVHNIVKAVGSDAVVFTAPDVYVGYELIAVRKDWAGQHAKEVRAYLRAMRRAERLITENSHEAQKIIAQATTLDSTTVADTWGTYDMRLTMAADSLSRAVTRIGDWIHSTQEPYADKPVPLYGPYFSSRYLDEMDK